MPVRPRVAAPPARCGECGSTLYSPYDHDRDCPAAEWNTGECAECGVEGGYDDGHAPDCAFGGGA